MTPRRLAICAESPLGGSGYLIDTLLAQAGIERSACFFGVLGPTLRDDLAAYDPHFVLLLDRFGGALRAFSGEKRGIDNWRGSVFTSTFTGKPIKVMATFHAARLQMEHGLTGVVRFDIARAVRELATDELVVPIDDIAIELSKDELLRRLFELRFWGLPVATDIEGYASGISCIGFARDANTAFVVPFIRHDNTSYWNEADELELWEAVAAVLEDPYVPKICHNALYEFFCLAWAYGIVIRGLEHDTMVMHFELYAEMEKSLGFCTSIYTAHPYYKSERKSTDDRALLLYNGKDCCRTYECWQVMSHKLMPKQREHYEFNMSLLVPLAFMSLRGFRYDKAAAERRLADVQRQIYEKQDEINREAASGTGWPRLTLFYEAIDNFGSGRHVANQADLGNGSDSDSTPDANPVLEDELRVRPGGNNLCESAPAADLQPIELNQNTPQKRGPKYVGCISRRLVNLFADAFCKARRTEEREVEETTWQPMLWNGKKWVKSGKRIIDPELAKDYIFSAGIQNGPWKDEPPAETQVHVALKVLTKKVLRNAPVAIQAFADVQRFAKDSCAADCRDAIKIYRTIAEGGTVNALCGQLTTLLDIHVKINATSAGGNAQVYLYDHCALPKQFQKEGNRLTTKLASDDEAVIKAWVASKDERALPFLAMRKLVTDSKYLVASPDADGRIRCGLNLVATPTCRMACYGSPTGTSDLNLQTIGKKFKNLFVADEGHFMYSKDLDGSDSWGVAAYCAMLGDRSMLNDNQNRLKPAKILACIYEQGEQINALDVEALKAECAKVDGEGWLYFACKRVLHGSNYGMGKITMSNQILTDSYKLLGKPVHLDAATCDRIQKKAFFVRYPGVPRWHAWMKREINEHGKLVASTGFQRKLFGRKDSHDTLKESLSHFPQYYTTYAIKLTLARQWGDPENRREDGSLRVEPLLLVHDSNVGQARMEDLEFARRKMFEWFQNPIQIAQETLTIPASSTWGPGWQHQDNKL